MKRNLKDTRVVFVFHLVEQGVISLTSFRSDEWIPAAVDESVAIKVVLNAAIERCFTNASRYRCKDVQTARPTIQWLYPLQYHCLKDTG